MPRKKRPSEARGAKALPDLSKAGGHNALEVRDPELAYKVAEFRLCNPEASYQQIGKATGVARDTVRDYLRRLEMRSTREWEERKAISQAALAEKFNRLAVGAVDAITDQKLAATSAEKLAVVAGIATDKHLLLTGQPTAIFGVEDRRKLHELIPALTAEAKRRGLTIEGEYKDVTPE